ncbi:TRAP transporter large permease subunit [Escherichia coli]|uniref:TRAP transporter large permease subunit n=1 Tax=Escherichia coli TaxID=562 RepID=UPI003D81A320
MRGGLGVANILVSTMMGGVSASNLADAAMLSRMMVPEMERKGYNRAFATPSPPRIFPTRTLAMCRMRSAMPV